MQYKVTLTDIIMWEDEARLYEQLGFSISEVEMSEQPRQIFTGSKKYINSEGVECVQRRWEVSGQGTVDLNTMKDLEQFIEKYGTIVIGKNLYRHDQDAGIGIEIYNGYRE